MANLDELKQFKRIHLIGIGGVSMSGIAEILKHWGFQVTGSDRTASAITNKLLDNGIDVTIGHSVDNVTKADLVVYSAAIPKDDIELLKARNLRIPSVDRATFLGVITRAYRNTICVSGTHGKSSTTAMVAMCFLEANLDPSIQVGAELGAIDGNYKVGNSEYFIMESCEYVESFLKFSPKAEIILNIDNDHLDYYKTIDNLQAAFNKYVKLLPDDGILVYNIDDPHCKNISQNTKAKSLTFGLNSKSANFIARNISFNNDGFPSFDVYYNNVFYKTINLSVPGEHNILNALACIALCNEFGLDKNDIKNALAKYTGIHRRMEYLGTCKGASIYDDYGHHPTEILSVANAIRNKKYNHSWVIFQPHTYSRTEALLDDFAKSLTNFDNIIVTDIYAAREKPTKKISSKDIVDKIEELGRKAYYIKDFEDIEEFVKRNVQENDIVITQGAGTITKVGHSLAKPKTSYKDEKIFDN